MLREFEQEVKEIPEYEANPLDNSSTLLLSAAIHVKNYLAGLDWREEDAIEREVAEILEDVDNRQSTIAEEMRAQFQQRMATALRKCMMIISKQKVTEYVASRDEGDDEARDQFDVEGAPLSITKPGSISSSTSGGPSSLDNHTEGMVVAMLHKKTAGLKKQLELAEQKARSATLQWTADKSRFKEMLEKSRRDQDELMRRLQIMERKVRQQEQIDRDPNMIKTEEDVKELDTVKEALHSVEIELSDKRRTIATMAMQLSDAKVTTD